MVNSVHDDHAHASAFKNGKQTFRNKLITWFPVEDSKSGKALSDLTYHTVSYALD